MFEFLRQHYERVPTDEMAGMLGSLGILSDGCSSDPALMSDWSDAVTTVMDAESSGQYSKAEMRLG
jgi:hypothetical protein